MQILFVIDNVKDLKNKIDTIANTIGGEFKFFVKSSCYEKVASNKFVLDNLVGVYEDNEKYRIDEYIKSNKYLPQDTLIYYASVNLDKDILLTMRTKIQYGYDSIFVKAKRNLWQKLIDKIYVAIASIVFRVKDANCSTKIQFLSQKFMAHLKDSCFHNHILDVKFSLKLEEENKINKKTLKDDIRFSKYYIYDLIYTFSLLLTYVLLEVFLKLKFYVYFTFVMGFLMGIFVAVIISTVSKFNARSKYLKNNEKINNK